MKKVFHYLNNELNLKDKDIIVVGVSGGPDSMALLSVLEEIRKKKEIYLICCHVNHNVRSVSQQEKEFLENWCSHHNIVFESMTIEKYGDDNFHNEARHIRYHYFEEIVCKYQAHYLMTAHHGDDLIETILMRLVRGSTLKGYAGFSQLVPMKDYVLVRPLIYVTKMDIEEFVQNRNIPYVIDESNYKDQYTRNRYRMEILPFLKKEDRHVHEKFFKFSKMLEQYDTFIYDCVQKEFSDVYQNHELNIDKFIKLNFLIQDKIIYQILEDIYHDDLILVNDKHVQLVKDLIYSKKKNTFIYLPNNIKLVKSYQLISVLKESYDVDQYEIQLIDYAVLPNGKHLEVVNYWESNGNDVCRLCFSDVTLPLYVRTRKHGEKIALKGTNGHKKIKDIFIDHKIPMKDRDLWPIVVDAKDQVVWIPGLKKSKFNRQIHDKCDIIVRYY
ncbi:MAG: tRNA lysidine(34) synthetase TilS [bacterium]|nr:tRNA lysidine(34) synthetase TilS [bacterium]